jgi:hypothetical protein
LALAGLVAVIIVLANLNNANGRAPLCEMSGRTVVASVFAPVTEPCFFGDQYGWPFAWKQLEFRGASDEEAMSGSLLPIPGSHPSRPYTYPPAIALNIGSFTLAGYLLLTGTQLLLKLKRR